MSINLTTRLYNYREVQNHSTLEIIMAIFMLFVGVVWVIYMLHKMDRRIKALERLMGSDN